MPFIGIMAPERSAESTSDEIPISSLDSEEVLTTMAHEDAGKYAAKHSPGTTLNEQIAKAIREQSSGGKLVCAMGEKISKELKVGIVEVGITADLLEMKIKECQ